jgi:putative ABC transport system permease protein
VEQREVTALLVRSATSTEEEDEDFLPIDSGFVLQSSINSQSMLKELDWSGFRPRLAKAEAQAINPVMEVTLLFDSFVNPIRWVLLLLTIMICVVSAISILVGIYSSMSQRRHEIAVIRALGANRGKVMMITLLEAITLAVLGGMLGWVAGHGLNALASPVIESRTGVSIGFWDFAPGVPILSYLGFSGVSGEGGDGLEWFRVSTELFLIPGLILLAVLVGMYPAISAYRTDVAKSLK